MPAKTANEKTRRSPARNDEFPDAEMKTSQPKSEMPVQNAMKQPLAIHNPAPKADREIDWDDKIFSEFPEAGELMEKMYHFRWKNDVTVARQLYKLMKDQKFTLHDARLLDESLSVQSKYRFPPSLQRFLSRREIHIARAIECAWIELGNLRKKRIEVFGEPDFHGQFIYNADLSIKRGEDLIGNLRGTMGRGGRCWPLILVAHVRPGEPLYGESWIDQWKSAEPEFQKRVRAKMLKEFSRDLGAYQMAFKYGMEAEHVYGLSMATVANEFSKTLTEIGNREKKLKKLLGDGPQVKG